MALVSDIEIRLRADIARLQQDMDRARQQVGSAMSRITDLAKGAGAALAAIGAGVAVAGLANFVKAAIDATDAVSDISQRTGVAIQDIAALQLWFQKGGNEAGVFEGAMIKLSRSISEGNAALESIGVSTRDANGNLRSNVDVLLDSADAFARMEDGTLKTALAIDAFGKSGAQLIPLLNEGSEGLREMQEMADKLGLTFNQQTVDAAGDFNDTLDFLGLAAQGVGRNIAAELLPTLNSLVGSLLNFVTSGDGVRKAAQTIAAGFKGIYTVGVGVVMTFTTLGKVIAGSMALVTTNVVSAFETISSVVRGSLAAISSGASGALNVMRSLASGDVAGAWQALGDAGKAIGNDLKSTFSDVYDTINMNAVKSTAIAVSSFEDVRDGLSSAGKAISDVWSGQGNIAVSAFGKVTSASAATTTAVVADSKKQKEELDQVNKILEKSQKAYDDLLDSLARNARDAVNERQNLIDSAREEAEQNEFLVETFGMTESAIIRIKNARLLEQEAQRLGRDLTADEIADLERVIELRERSAQAVAKREELEQTKQFWSDIEKTARDTFVSIADGGKNAFQRLKETAKNTFFDWLYQQTLKKWIINIGTSVSGGGLAGLAQASGGGASSAMDWIATGKKIYDGFSTGFASVGSGLGAYVSQLGSLFGSSSLSAFGAGMGLTSSQASAAAAAYNSAGMAGTGSAITAGSYAGSAASVAAGAAIGHYGGRALSNGFSAFGGSGNSSTNVGTVAGMGLGYYLGGTAGAALGAALGGVIGGAINRVFGRKPREYQDATLSGSLTDGGVINGKVSSSWLEKGGWFRSDKRGVEVQSINSEMSTLLSNGFNAVRDVTASFAQTFGESANVIAGYSKTLNFKISKDAAENEKNLASLFGEIGNELATKLVPNIGSFVKEGETASLTLERLAGNFKIVDGVLVTLGVTSQQAFGAVGVASIAARERLIELSGGVQSLASQTQFYADNFLTAAQQVAPLQRQVNEELAALGYAGITTAEQFRDAVQGLVNGGALATEAGARTYAGLLALAPAFKTVSDYLKEISDAAKEAEREAAIAGSDLAISLLERSVNAQKDMVSKGFQESMERFERDISGVNDAIARTSDLSRALASARLRIDSPEQMSASRQAAQAQIASAIALARAGGALPSAEDLADALSALGQDSSGEFSSLADYQREVARTNNQLLELGGLTDNQLSLAERQLKALQDQKAQAEIANEAELSKLDGVLAKAQAQIDALRGVDNRTLAVEDAVKRVELAVRDLANQSGAPIPQQGGITTAPPVFYTSLPPSSTMQSNEAMLAEMRNMNARLAASEASNQQTAAATQRLADQFNAVSGGGNALLTEPA